MTTDMDELRERVRQAIINHFGCDVVKDVRIEEIEIFDDKQEIRFVFNLETDADPKIIGRRLFGLTAKVRAVLGDELEEFFPILQSETNRGIAA